jgi:hypothetical protein
MWPGNKFQDRTWWMWHNSQEFLWQKANHVQYSFCLCIKQIIWYMVISLAWQLLRLEFIALRTKISSSPRAVTLVCTTIALKAGWVVSLPRLVVHAAMATWALCFMDYSYLKCRNCMPLDMWDDFKSTKEEKNMTRNKITQLDILTNRHRVLMGITSNQSKIILSVWEQETNLSSSIDQTLI